MNISSPKELKKIAEKINKVILPGDFIFLYGEIGTGKTTFTRFLINYLQKKEGSEVTDVLSPTFNLLYEYKLKKYKILHYDLYRINEEKELYNLGFFQDEEKTVKIIEWPNKIKIPLSDKLEIYLDYAKNNNERKLKFIGKGKWKNFK